MIKHILALFALAASAFAEPAVKLEEPPPELKKFIAAHLDVPFTDLFHGRYADKIVAKYHEQLVTDIYTKYKKMPQPLMGSHRDLLNPWAAVSCVVHEGVPYVQFSAPTLVAVYEKILAKHPDKVADAVFEQTLVILYLHSLEYIAAGYADKNVQDTDEMNLNECLIWAETCRNLIVPMAEAGRTMGDTEFGYLTTWNDAGRQTFSQKWLDFFTKPTQKATSK